MPTRPAWRKLLDLVCSYKCKCANRSNSVIGRSEPDHTSKKPL
jgi:hypothetical protein